jgi:exodeoxyribonuclease VII large subunit
MELAVRAGDTTRDNPWPVRVLSQKIAQYIDRMVPLWIEGQVVQLNKRPGAGMAFLTIRDTDQDMSLPVSIYARSLEQAGPLAEGAHVVAHVKPTFWTKRGTLQMQAKEIAQVGIGELLARIEQLKAQLGSEGLFDPERKKPLPFLPKRVGLICGRESEALHDVLVNARARWPEVQFEVREVAVQGVHAVPQVTAALRELDEIADVEVIVIARGGGAVEDLLPFSNESLVRAVAQAHTPIVSAIGHERDTPLLDFVADVRASTPTDAAKRIVPHVAEERAGIAQTLARARAAVNARIQREQHGLDMMRSRPALAQPTVLIDAHEDRLRQLIARSRTVFERSLLDQSARIRELTTHVRALSPLTTLERGYAVIQSENGSVITSPEQALGGATVHVRVQRGAFSATVNPPHSLPLLNGAEPHPTELS